MLPKPATSRFHPSTRWWARLWVYQQERFPLFSHATLVGVMVVSSLGYSLIARGATHPPTWQSLVTAFVFALGSFLLLRIADEHKDAAEDNTYRPYRPVPRGLVSLTELNRLGAVTGLAQATLILWYSPLLLPLLGMVWATMALMRVEFGAAAWLQARPLLYTGSHMLILPLIVFTVTACDWLVAQAGLPPGWQWLLGASFCTGLAFEIGRKVRAPADEEVGVPTYTQLWGRPRAVGAWLGALGVAGLCSVGAALSVNAQPAQIALLLLWAAAAGLAYIFIRQPERRWARLFQPLAALWTLTLYAGLGLLPLVQLL